MALTGFDPSIVHSSINSVKTAYESLMNALYERVQREFVGGMASKWACKDAQDYFNNFFKPNIDKLLAESDKVFDSVVASMNTAGQAWASRTEGTYNSVGFSPYGKTIDVSGILENIGGVRGIDLDQANAVAGNMAPIADAAKSACASAKAAVSSCGFIGGSQAANLQASLGKINDNINEAVATLTNLVKKSIASTVEQYSDTEGRVSQAFASRG